MNQKLFKAIAISTVLVFTGCKKANIENDAKVNVTETQKEPDNLVNTKENITELYGLTEVKFDKREFDFGTLNQGDKAETTFTVTNTGEKDLVITDAHGSCGCMVPEVSKEPIAPGKSTVIKVKFDSTGKQGLTEKTVFVTCNTKTIVENLIIKANILTKK
jgi:Protein of unknown function (DUF1573)